MTSITFCLLTLRHTSRLRTPFTTINFLSVAYSNKDSSNIGVNTSSTINSFTHSYYNHRKHTSKNDNMPLSDEDSQLRHFISSDMCDPNNFGTLSDDWKVHQQLKTMPDEDDDILEKEYLQNREGKTRLTTNQYAKIIKRFLHQKKLGHALDVLETRMLKDDHVKPENYIYNLLIGACGQVGYTKKAFKLYNQMKERGLKVTGHTYTGLFNACANSPFPADGLRRAQLLRITLVEKAVLLNQIVYHAMIKAFGRCGDMETAFMLVDEMLEKKITVTDETFNFLLQACITDKTAGFRHALLVWRKMLEKRIRPTLYSFNLMLHCSRECGLGDEAAAIQVIKVLLKFGRDDKQNVLRSLPSNNNMNGIVTSPSSDLNVPNLISQEPTMGSIVALKNISLPEHRLVLLGGSKGVLEQMRLFNIKPNVKTFTQLLDQLPPTLMAEQELLDAVKKSEVSVDVDFYNMLIRKRCLRGDYHNAKEVLKLIQEKNMRPDIMTFGVLAMSCNSPSAARQLLQDIDRIGYRPNVEIVGTLLKNACYRRDCDFIIEMMKKLKDEDLKPNDTFLKHLDNFYRFASKALKHKETDDTGNLKIDKFKEYCEYYRCWRQEMCPDVIPHPWNQFQETPVEPEDMELLNYGKVK